MKRIVHHRSLADSRRLRVRSKLHGTTERPRLTVYRSNQHTYLQVIDDSVGKTLAAANTLQLKKTGTKAEDAQAIAAALLTQLKKKGITKLVFDRGHYRYHGRLKTVAEALRQAQVEV